MLSTAYQLAEAAGLMKEFAASRAKWDKAKDALDKALDAIAVARDACDEAESPLGVTSATDSCVRAWAEIFAASRQARGTPR